MGSMTAVPREREPLPPLGEWTVSDLVDQPDNGLRYELLDGQMLVTPAPAPMHQLVVGELFVLLRAASPPGYRALMAPVDWQPDPHTSLQPDLLVVAVDDIGDKNVSAPLALAVEVLSPSTRRTDRLLKRSRYEDGGVGAYWIVDPTGPSIEALVLVDGVYEREASATGDETVTIGHPFPVTLRPADLIRR